MEAIARREKDKDVSRIVDQGRAESSMHHLVQAVREVDAQHQVLQCAQRKRMEELRAAARFPATGARKSLATGAPAIPPKVDLAGCRAAVLDAERACQDVYEQQIFTDQPGSRLS